MNKINKGSENKKCYFCGNVNDLVKINGKEVYKKWENCSKYFDNIYKILKIIMCFIFRKERVVFSILPIQKMWIYLCGETS